ncbi:MAG: dihydroorotate dehydrogenase 2 [Chloroflexi bacterium]|nr:dihydroorotate dehydrogenase 2 [Chloroflexota bacterium]
MGLYTALGRPLLFRLPAETSHRLAETALRVGPLWAASALFTAERPRAASTAICGVSVPSPIGIAAGFDKNCRVIGSLLALGFGFAVGGTVTLKARPGNPRPRLLRDQRARALVNSLGFPGDGLDAVERRLRRLPVRHRSRTFVSVAGTEDEDVLECHSRLEPLVSGVEVNISSPNTAGLRVYQAPERLRVLVGKVAAGKKRPLLIKLPRYDGPEGEVRLIALARAAVDGGADGLVVANTLPVKDGRLAVGQGGLSGAPLLDSTLRLVEAVRHATPGHVAIVGCGGVFTGQEVGRILSAGAVAVQLYTSLIYEGPGLPRRLAREVSR